MSDKNNQQLLSYDLEDQFCEDLSVEEMNKVQGGLQDSFTNVYLPHRPVVHPLPINPAPKPIDGVISIHPRPRKFPSHPGPFIIKDHKPFESFTTGAFSNAEPV